MKPAPPVTMIFIRIALSEADERLQRRAVIGEGAVELFQQGKPPILLGER